MKIRKKIRFFSQALLQADPKMVYVQGWHGHNNLGDEAIYSALRKLFNGINFVDFTKGTECKFAARKISQINRAILGGGTTIGYKLSSLRNLKYCFDMCSKTLVFGAGVADLNGWREKIDESSQQKCKKLWKVLLEKCVYVGVRGPRSAELLTDCGINGVEVIGDPVLALSREQLPNCNSVASNTVGINIGQARGNVWGEQDSICEQYIKLAGLVKKAGWHIKWFVVWPKDLSVTRQVATASGTGDEIHEIYEDYERYMNLIGSLNVFVGMKLHSVVLATSTYVPSIMLEYQPKCRDYMRSIGQDENTIRTDHFEAENVWELITALNSHRRHISESLFRAIKSLRELQEYRADQLKGVLLKNT
jgi:polysaccharide pyruvyl transferase WcaK-like protein